MKKRDKIVSEERVTVKLPKLVMTKLDGKSLDWFRFWNQFKSEIDKAEIGPVGKLSYLKEFLIPRVRLFIDGGPPFLHLRVIQEPNLYYLVSLLSQMKVLLPVFKVLPRYLFQNSHPNRLDDFYEKLVINVLVLDTMNKLTEINGYVRLTLDKLHGIRVDLQNR